MAIDFVGLFFLFLQERHNECVKQVREARLRQNFTSSLNVEIESGTSYAIVPTPYQAKSTTRPFEFIFSVCTGCGGTLMEEEVYGLFWLPCSHAYHPLCFTHICSKYHECVKDGCTQIIPKAAKEMVMSHVGNFKRSCTVKGMVLHFCSG